MVSFFCLITQYKEKFYFTLPQQFMQKQITKYRAKGQLCHYALQRLYLFSDIAQYVLRVTVQSRLNLKREYIFIIQPSTITLRELNRKKYDSNCNPRILVKKVARTRQETKNPAL
jgi:hypothetical protein